MDIENSVKAFKNAFNKLSEEDRNVVSYNLHKENERVMRDIAFGIPSYRIQRRSSSNRSTTTMVLVG